MRHPLSTPGSGSECGRLGGWAEGPVAVGDVDVLVVGDVLGQAVPEDLQPAVAQGAQRGMVFLAAVTLRVVELSRPAGGAQAGEGPLLYGVGEVAVAGQPGGDDELAFARAAGDRGFAGVALQRVRRVELSDRVADFTGDPGGESISEPWKAEVDLAARHRRPPLVSWLFGPSSAPVTEQQFAHASLPVAALLAQQQQLGAGQADGVGLGADQVVLGLEVVGGQGLGDAVGEAVRPAVLGLAGEGLDLVAV